MWEAGGKGKIGSGYNFSKRSTDIVIPLSVLCACNTSDSLLSRHSRNVLKQRIQTSPAIFSFFVIFIIAFPRSDLKYAVL